MSFVDDIIAAARAQVGVPFVLGKRYAGRALDCVGLLEVVAEQCGRKLLGPPGYSKLWLARCDAHKLMIQAGGIEKVGAAEPGDIVRLSLQSGLPIHFGIVTGNTLIHACPRRKLVVEDWYANCMEVCVRGVYQWPS